MLTLITGLPGNGKTLYALQYVFDLVKREAAGGSARPVYYHGIKGLKPELGWLMLGTRDEHLQGEKNPPAAVPIWWDVPPRSIVIIDEAQMCGFGTRMRGQVPEWAQKLETHRHMGIDIVFITQDPSLVDSHDRKLMELHFHVMRSFGMQRAIVHEFRPVRDNPLKTRKGSIQHRWSYPKHVFEWYQSAEAHTHKRRVPAKVLIFASIPFFLAGISWFTWTHYLDPHRVKPGAEVAPGAAGALATGGAFNGSGGGGARGKSPAEYAASFQPRIAGLPHTAPAYDEVTRPTEAPIPAACVSSASKGCLCYTQQGTRLDTAADLCRSIVAGGFYVAWAQKSASQMPRQDAQQPRESQDQPRSQLVGWNVGRRGDGQPAPSASILGKSGETSAPSQAGRGRALAPPSGAQ